MVSLIGKAVRHKKFGQGTVVKQNEKNITATFPVGEKEFVYPDAFECFLTADDEQVRTEIRAEIEAAVARRNEQREEAERIRQEEKKKLEERRAEVNRAAKNARKNATPSVRRVRVEPTLFNVPTVESMEELLSNCMVLDEYIASRKDPEYSFALGLIKRGTCFVALKTNDGYRFYPSRFVGYQNNSMSTHESNGNKDGRVTNPAIGALLGQTVPQPDAEIDALYKEYCKSLGMEPNAKGTFGVDHKFWIVDLVS